MTSNEIVNCFSSTIETTRIAAAHIIDWEINNFLFIYNILIKRNWLLSLKKINPPSINHINSPLYTVIVKTTIIPMTKARIQEYFL